MRRLIALSITLLASIALAQRSPTGTTSRTMLAMMPDVKKELKATKDQDKKIMAAMKEMEQKAQSGQVRIDLSDPMASFDIDMGPILDDTQKVRLEELYAQYNGGFALADPKFVSALAINEETLARIKAIKSTAARELPQMLMNARSASAAKDADKKREEFSLQMLALLTDEQKAKFETMKGKAFKFKT
jgi:Spy/CpxP family protein refolding chaperone